MRLLCIIVLFSTLSAHGQNVLSLEDCVQRAIEQNLIVQQSKLNVTNESINVRRAKMARWPTLNSNLGGNQQFGRTIDPTTNSFANQSITSGNLGLTSNVLLFGGNQINNSIKQSKASEKAAEFDYWTTANDIALQVSQSYLNLLLLKEQTNLAKSRVDQSQDQLNRIRRIIAVGNAAPNDSLNLTAQLANDYQALIQSNNSEEQAQLLLSQLIMYDGVFELEEPASFEIFVEEAQAKDAEQVYQSALSNQPEIQSAQKNIESAQYGEKIAKSNYFPTIGASGNLNSYFSSVAKKVDGYQTVYVDQNVVFMGQPAMIGFEQEIPIVTNNSWGNQLNENFGQSFGVNVSIPIINGFNAKLQTQQAQLRTKQAELNAQTARQNLKNDVYNAVAASKASAYQYQASKASFDASQSAYDNALKRYEVASLSIYDVNTARQQLVQAENNLVIAKYDYLFKLKVVEFYLGESLRID